jgi:hypothetical protein
MYDRDQDGFESIMPDMIEDYFQTKFNDGCDYALPHFNSGQIRTQRLYALRDGQVRIRL